MQNLKLKYRINRIIPSHPFDVLRYYLSYDNDEDLARGLLILFFPFRNEYEEIHLDDVKQLLRENLQSIEEKRVLFEKYK